MKRQDDVGYANLDAQGKPFKPAVWAARNDILAANQDALRLVRVGLTQDYYQPPNRNVLAEFPYLKGYRNVARLLALDANARFARGDRAGGASSALEGVAFGEQIARGGSLIPRLVSVACQAIVRRPLWLNLNRLDAQTARRSARHLEDLAARRIPMADTLTEEKYVLQTSLAQIFSGEYFKNQPMTPAKDEEDGEEERRLPPGMLYAIEPKAQTYRDATVYMDALIALSQKPYAKRGSGPTLPRGIINAILLPASDTFLFRQTASEETQTALLTAALALRAYQAEHGGALPADLQALVAGGYLRRVPADPFAPHGASLRFKTVTGTLYSVGPDGKDNGGKAIYDVTQQEKARHQVLPESTGDVVADVNGY